MSTHEPTPTRRRPARRPSAARRALWWTVCLVPLVAAFGLQWLPIFNGPHLFLGLPTIMWWTCLPGSLLVSLMLGIVEWTRTDSAEQDRLDAAAVRAAERRENRGGRS
ncbi:MULTISPECIES: hypothetical protein [Micrococcales]|uniref:hypothetical protein n=1 Tax=Micrococcales TaxID=85006 RepID=UPI0004AB871C|nr:MULTISPECIES: hypothetical protein [Micrococcales]